MFDDEFFPTPGIVAAKMLAPYVQRCSWRRSAAVGDLPIFAILDPSAGKGDLLDSVRARFSNYGTYNGPQLLAIEQSPELIGILQSKGYRVIGRDFLEYQRDDRVDLVLMNPPFSTGARHLLRAWEVLDRGDIACLLNAETIRNPCTEERKLLAKIIEDHGSVEFIGQAFQRAERPTDVEVALVRLQKARVGKSHLDFDFQMPSGPEEGLPDFGQQDAGTAIMRPDRMGSLIRQYDMAKAAFVDFLKAREALTFYCGGVIDAEKVMDLASEACGSGRHGNTAKEQAFDAFKDSIRLKFWEHILQQVGMEKYLTSNLRKKFGEFIEQQGSMALTKENIHHLLETMLLNSKSIMSQSVVTVFDMFTRFHKENRLHPEGWKTNDFWKVNRRVILPNYVRYDWGKFATGFSRYSEYNDIDRAMCYLTGKRFEDIETLEKAIKPDANTSESTFFRMRYFKKGTLHLEFKDPALWERFNLVACEGKNWLGSEASRAAA